MTATFLLGLALLAAKAEKQGIHFAVDWRGNNPYAKNENESMMPASVLKMITARNALEKLGPDYKFSARLKWKRTDTADASKINGLRLIGDGDPSWGFEELKEDEWTRVTALAELLHQKGVRVVEGDVVLEEEDGIWKELPYPEGWTETDSMSCYGAMPTAFNVQRNCAAFVVTGINSGHFLEYGVDTKVRFEIKRGTTNRVWIERDAVFDPKTVMTAGYVVKGELASQKVLKGFILPIMNAKGWIKNLFKRALEKKGIQFIPVRSSSNDTIEETTVLESPPLYKILQPMLKNSSNLIAQALFNKILINKILINQMVATNLEDKALSVIKDGAGLSRSNRIAPSELYSILEKIRLETYFTWIWDALPIAGVDGTLKNRLRSTVAQGKVRAKTGTLNGVSNLAGYIPKVGKNGEITALHPYVLMTSYKNGFTQLSRSYQDKMTVSIFTETSYNHSP